MGKALAWCCCSRSAMLDVRMVSISLLGMRHTVCSAGSSLRASTACVPPSTRNWTSSSLQVNPRWRIQARNAGNASPDMVTPGVRRYAAFDVPRKWPRQRLSETRPLASHAQWATRLVEPSAPQYRASDSLRPSLASSHREMGNTLSHTTLTAPTAALPSPEDVLSDLPASLSVKSSLGGGRFLKTVRLCPPWCASWQAVPSFLTLLPLPASCCAHRATPAAWSSSKSSSCARTRRPGDGTATPPSSAWHCRLPHWPVRR